MMDRGARGELYVPYRALIPKGVDNLLAAGHCVAYKVAAGALLGQAAGTAAALTVKSGLTPRQLDVPTLQAALKDQGFIFASIEPNYSPA